MTDNPDRRRLMQLSLALPALLTLARHSYAENPAPPLAGGNGPEHDFDYFFGAWRVRHRRLKQRLAGRTEWEEFDGSTECRPLLGGLANLNDSIVHRPAGTYRGMGLRAFDAKTSTWADWYLDGRNPRKVETHGVGRFAGGVGTFLSDDTFEGRPVKVRGLFSPLTATACQWEQAFSADGGRSWETNYVMHYTRIT